MNHFAVTITALGSAAALLGLILGLLVRITRKWTQVEDKLATLTDQVAVLVEQKEEAHNKLYDAIRDDRNATNKRLTYLERNVWPKRK